VPLHEEFIQEQMAGLSEAEQRTLHTLLRRLDRSLDA
jgi:succinate dehydrogenase flavin-adding protein (antitoxin of CptAB toxin-antitoxin module)